MPTFHDEIIQGSDSWLAFRKDKITATDIAVIMGISPYKSPYMLWQEKLGFIDPEPENDAMRRGKELEPLALEAYCKITGRNMTPAVATHSQYPWAMCSLDAMDSTGLIIAEIKCMGKKNHEEAMTGHVKPLYNAQMQWQMFVTGLNECDYFVYSEESNHLMTIKRDQDLINQMIIAAQEFLQMIETITPPPYTDLDYEDKSDDAYWNSLMECYADYDAMEKKGKAGKDHIKKQLVDAANGRNVKGVNSRFTKVVSKGRVQYDQIPQLFGLDLDQYRSPDVEFYKITQVKD